MSTRGFFITSKPAPQATGADPFRCNSTNSHNKAILTATTTLADHGRYVCSCLLIWNNDWVTFTSIIFLVSKPAMIQHIYHLLSYLLIKKGLYNKYLLFLYWWFFKFIVCRGERGGGLKREITREKKHLLLYVSIHQYNSISIQQKVHSCFALFWLFKANWPTWPLLYCL